MKAANIALLWLGVVLGVAFLATPVKFAAPSLDLPTALEVGRVTFRMLARVEWVFALVLLVTAMMTRERLPWSTYVVLAVLVLESAWLLPTLGVRTDAIRAGVSLPPSHLHDIFVVAKLLECAMLGHIVVATSRAPQPAIPLENPPHDAPTLELHV